MSLIPPQRYRWAWFVLAAVAIAGLLSWLGLREPRYQGIPATDFAFQLLISNRLSSLEIANQLRPMGTNMAVRSLVKAIEREDSFWRRWYPAAYGKCPPGIRRHLPKPASNPFATYQALQALRFFGPGAAPALPLLTRLYQRGDNFVSADAFNAILALGPKARDVLPLLLGSLASTNNRFFRAATIQALPQIDPSGALTAAAIEPLLRDREVEVAYWTVISISKMARQSPHLVTNLWVGLGRPEVRICEAAAGELKRHDALTRLGIEPFLHQLNDDKAPARTTAAMVLRHGGKFATNVVPALCLAAHDRAEPVRTAALSSLADLAWESSVPRSSRLQAAEEVLRQGDENRCWLTMNMLPELLPDSASLAPMLITALEHRSPRIRGKAAQTLGGLGGNPKIVVPALIKATKDEWLNVRDAATNALMAFPPNGRRGERAGSEEKAE